MNWTPHAGDQVPQILRGYPRLERAMIAADVEPMTVDRLLNVELPDLTAVGGSPGGHLVGGTADFPAVEGDTVTFEVLSLGPNDARCCPSVHTTVRFRWNGTDFEPV